MAKCGRKRKAMKGKRYGRLVVLEDIYPEGGKKRCLVQCDCGQTKVVQAVSLISGDTRSCGCLYRDSNRRYSRFVRLNGKRMPLIEAARQMGVSLSAMSRRATRGTKLNMPLRRQIPDGEIIGQTYGYWIALRRATHKDPRYRYFLCRCICGEERAISYAALSHGQSNSCDCRTGRLLTYDGRTMNITRWARHIGISYSVLRWRLKNWPLDRALSQPLDTRKRGRAK